MPSEEALPFSYARSVLGAFSPEELSLVAQLKRFFEWYEGDPAFRKRMEAGPLSRDDAARLERIGVRFEPKELAMLWEAPEDFAGLTRRMLEAPDQVLAACADRPLLKLWLRFLSLRTKTMRDFHTKIYEVTRISASPRFDAWRSRRIAAIKSELGFFGYHLGHPVLAIELGDGCSIGCWFCAFAARKLTRNLDYDADGEFARDIVRACLELFGREAMALALPYYGTEPHDHPRYLDFLRDYAAITGYRLCTSTAVATDAAWIRSLIDFYRSPPEPSPWPRLSVLSAGMLRSIHETYSPDELRDVSLLMQMRDHPRGKVPGGRILAKHEDLRDRGEGHYLDGTIPQGSIACVSGFLVNLVNRTIELCSPCYTNAKWPYGYRVFDRASFHDGADFRAAIAGLIERNMPDAPCADMPMRFRDDLVYRPTDDGFDLVSPNQIHHFRGDEVTRSVGSFVAGGQRPYRELFETAPGEEAINPILAVSVVHALFDGGFLDEVYRGNDSGHAGRG